MIGEIPVEGYVLEICKWESDDDYYIDDDINIIKKLK